MKPYSAKHITYPYTCQPNMFLCKVSQWSVWHFLWSTVEVLLWTVNQLNCLWFISPLQGHFWVIIREEWQSVYYLQHKRGSLPSSFKRLNHFLWFWGVLIRRDIWMGLFCCLFVFYLFNECVYLWCMGVCTHWGYVYTCPMHAHTERPKGLHMSSMIFCFIPLRWGLTEPGSCNISI